MGFRKRTGGFAGPGGGLTRVFFYVQRLSTAIDLSFCFTQKKKPRPVLDRTGFLG
jgi:hypothetical protein